jgi:hypothetical protein
MKFLCQITCDLDRDSDALGMPKSMPAPRADSRVPSAHVRLEGIDNTHLCYLVAIGLSYR